MTKLSFAFSLLLSTTLAVADCQFSDGTKTVWVKEGEAVSLRDPGKSLDKMTIQDQDGLNTCYANVTSTILKSVLPDHPTVSYTHAAIMGTTRGWQEDWSEPNKKYLNKKNPTDNFTSFGWVCETVAGLKNAGGACPSSLSSTENKQLWDSGVQQRLFYGLGTYFDQMNLIKNDPIKFDKLKKDLALSIEAISVENAAMVEQCEERKSSKFPVFDSAKTLIEAAFYDHVGEPTKCTEAKTNALKKLLSPQSELGKDRFKIIPSNETLDYFARLIESDPEISKDLESYVSNPEARLKNYPDLIAKFGPKLNTALLSLVPDNEFRNECQGTSPGQSVFLAGEVTDNSRSFISQIKSNKVNPCNELLQPYILDEVLKAKSCLAPTNTDMILSAMYPLIEMNVAIDQQLLPMLLNPESRYADQIIKAIMPGCLDKTKLVDMKNLACGTFSFCDPTGNFNDNNVYSGPKSGCYEFEKAKKMVRTKTFAGINEGRAIGVAVCSAFLTNPDMKSNFCTSGLPEGEKHASHEMTITGYRCKENRIEYEIVNSWGTSCEDNKNIECQKDANGDTTGPSWIKEDALVDNSTDLTTISVKKP
jgi:hypothetical protein